MVLLNLFLLCLQLVFLALKVDGAVVWAWWIVFLPLIAMVLINLIRFAGGSGADDVFDGFSEAVDFFD